MADPANRKVKICLGLPWYNGADKDCVAQMLVFQHYLGRLQERLWWLKHLSLGYNGDPTYSRFLLENICPPLDPVNNTGFSEIRKAMIGTEFEFGIAEEIGLSLPGMARERIVDYALKWEADYVLFYDDDMIFGTDLFLRLYLDEKPVVAALAFTARKPISPVIYKFYERIDQDRKECPQCHRMLPFHAERCETDGEKAVLREVVDIQPVFDYQRDTLQKVDAVGAGVVLIQTDVFRKLPKPWFHSPGIGEDIFFCWQCAKNGVAVWVDTRVKTIHKPREAERWHDEKLYEEQLRNNGLPERLNHSHSDMQQPAAVA